MARVDFGLLLPHGPASPGQRADFVAACDRGLGRIRGHLTSVWMSDHFQMGTADVLECWTTLAYFAGRHPDLSFGTAVACQAYRNPALLAKTAATFQFLTGGRLTLGVGAGWNEAEFRAYNYPFPPAGVRVSEVAEAVRIITSLWTREETTFEGQHYQVYGAHCEPRPDPVPPIGIGGHGPRMLRVAARLADGWDVTGSGLARDEYPAVAATMARILGEVSRDPSTLRRSYSGPCVVATTDEKARELKGRLPEGKGITGTPDQVVDQLGRLIEQGVTAFQLVFAGFPDTEVLDLFLARVLPQVKGSEAG